jgi:hypothetical protein
MGGKGSSSTVTVHNGPITVDSDSTVDVKGLNDIHVDATVHPLSVRQELVIPEPIRTISNVDTTSNINTSSDVNTKSDVTSDSTNAISVDLKPVVLDVCSTTSTKLPHGEICQPFNIHFGMTWFGVEFLGFNFGGESRTVMRDLPKKPAVDWPAQQNAAPHVASSARDDAPSASARGLRIRIK